MMPKLNLTQWIAIIGFSASVIGYVIHLESIHVQEGIDRDRSVKQRDSIIQAMAVQNMRINEFNAALINKINSDDAKEDAEDVRLDRIETDGVVTKTKFEDFLLYYKTKK